MAETPSVEITAKFSRRAFAAMAGAVPIGKSTRARAAIVKTDFSKLPPYGNGTIPTGIRSRHIANVNGMTVHVLEAGYETQGRPAVLLLHGFPELAYSWRKVMPSLAAAGYHVIAPDQRGYGRTIGWDDSYDADPTKPFCERGTLVDSLRESNPQRVAALEIASSTLSVREHLNYPR